MAQLVQLRPLLERVGATQRDLAQAIGVREESVSRWVHGQMPQGRHLVAIVEYLRARDQAITLGDLMDGRAA